MTTACETKPCKPAWLRGRISAGENTTHLKQILDEHRLHTVCDEALCPNKGECWNEGRATVMILGSACSRACRFCNVETVEAAGVDESEPERVADAVSQMNLNEIVLTSVTRDDLPDGGSRIWAETIKLVRKAAPDVTIEVLIPDFQGDWPALDLVLDAEPDVLGHNLETIPSLYPQVRPEAVYTRSLDLLQRAHNHGLITKTGLMLGLGETPDAVLQTMQDARNVGCDIFFAGQYLQPSEKHIPVERFVEPDEFESYRTRGLEMGFSVVASSPLIRSSFHTDEQKEFISSKKDN